jgi:hypothetical protein
MTFFDERSIDELNNHYIEKFKAIRRENCQDEPHLIATTPEEADEILAMWEAGR